MTVTISRTIPRAPDGVAIHAELTADETSIVCMAAGPAQGIIKAAQRLSLITPTVHKSDPPGAVLVDTSWAAVVQLSATFGQGWMPGPRLQRWIFNEVLRRGPVDPDPLTCLGRLPAGVTPREYQSDGAKMIAALGRALLFDDPGTGKTVTAILGILELACYNPAAWPVLIIAPAGVVDTWVEMWQEWAPDRPVVAWRGPDRRSLAAGEPDVYVASYDVARLDAAIASDPLPRLGALTVVVDECQYINNPKAARSTATRRLTRHAHQVIELSGTPIKRDSGDLWPVLNAMEPQAWPSSERYKTRYCEIVPGDYRDEIIGLSPHTEPEFRTVLLGQYRRVSKEDVLDQLPPKVYTTHWVELPAAYRRAYDQMEDDMLAKLPDGQKLPAMDVLNQFHRLVQLASAAADVSVTWGTDPRTGEPAEHVHVTLKLPSWKVDELLDIVAERPDRQILVFAPSRQLVNLAGETLTDHGRRVGYITGAITPAKRKPQIEAFQRGDLDVMCLTTGAGGVGITLTAASTEVFLQSPPSLVERLQSEDRAHRIGSEIHESIEIIDVVARNTVESRIREILKIKAGNLADLVQDPRIVAQLLGGKR
jgi:SNF2 family DNA or RNA helicase